MTAVTASGAGTLCEVSHVVGVAQMMDSTPATRTGTMIGEATLAPAISTTSDASSSASRVNRGNRVSFTRLFG